MRFSFDACKRQWMSNDSFVDINLVCVCASGIQNLFSHVISVKNSDWSVFKGRNINDKRLIWFVTSSLNSMAQRLKHMRYRLSPNLTARISRLHACLGRLCCLFGRISSVSNAIARNMLQYMTPIALKSSPPPPLVQDYC